MVTSLITGDRLLSTSMPPGNCSTLFINCEKMMDWAVANGSEHKIPGLEASSMDRKLEQGFLLSHWSHDTAVPSTLYFYG